jgi:hypothetical protein
VPTSAKTVLRLFLQGLSKVMFLIAVLSFFAGDRVLRASEKMDFVLAEFLGLGFAAICFGAGLIAKSKAEDIEWEEANEQAMKTSLSPHDQPKP